MTSDNDSKPHTDNANILNADEHYFLCIQNNKPNTQTHFLGSFSMTLQKTRQKTRKQQQTSKG